MPLAYLNHAGAGLPRPSTVAAITAHLAAEAEGGPMEAGGRAEPRLAKGYQLAAQLLGAQPREIAFGSGHGQLYGDLIAAIDLKPGDRILVSRQEWVGNLNALKRRADEIGATLETMPSDATTGVDVAAVKAMLDDRVRIVALTWIGASSPLVNPAADLGRALAGSRALYLIDASQAIGQIPIDVAALGCDLLIACGRKYLRGPRGSGLAYIRAGVINQLQPRSVDDWNANWAHNGPHLRDDARRFETAEFSVAVRLGFVDAIEQAIAADPAATSIALWQKAERLRQRLGGLSRVRVLDTGTTRGAFVTFAADGLKGAAAKQQLAEKGIIIGRHGGAYTPIDLEMRGIDDVLRASVHLETDDATMDALCRALD